MRLSVLIAVNLFACAIVAVPTQNSQSDFSKSFQSAVNNQNFETILVAIENRLRNLDNIYSMHLSQTLEDKLEQYQRKLDAIDTKINRFESLAMLNLDKISENISMKNFKDDIAKTNLVKKIDAMYEGLTYRINYVERKGETNSNKILNKVDTTITRLEKMEESSTRRNEDIDIELSDAIAAIDDLKTACTMMEQNIVNNTNENFEVALKEQTEIMKSYEDKSNNAVKNLFKNATGKLFDVQEIIVKELQIMNKTDAFLRIMKAELKEELNEYAVKVAEMNAENWKSETSLKDKQNQIGEILNVTKTDVQNGIRALMVLIGKITPKEQFQELPQMDQLNKKIDFNFEKVFSAQNLFIDSCYRLQMDEPQIEKKISTILEKLMKTFEKKTTIEIKDIKNLEKLIKSHDSHITRNLYQTSTNIVSVYEKVTKDHNLFERNLQQAIDHLNDLFSLVRDTLANENEPGTLTTQTLNRISQDLKAIGGEIYILNKQGSNLKNYTYEIKNMINEGLTKPIGNISDVIAGIEAKVNRVYLDYYFKRSTIKQTKEIKTVFNTTTNENASLDNIDDVMTTVFGSPSKINNSEIVELEKGRKENRDKLIKQIFLGRVEINAPENKTTFETKNVNCSQNYLDLIDVRSNFIDESGCHSENNSRDNTDTSEESNVSIEEDSTEYEDAIEHSTIHALEEGSAEINFDLKNTSLEFL